MNTFYTGDVLEILSSLPSESIHCCVTSPPYFGLRDYGTIGQIGLEQTPEDYVNKLVSVFKEVRRVLRKDGTVWLNLGDCYNSTPPGNKNPMSKSGLNGAQTSQRYRERLIETQQHQQEGRRLLKKLKPKDLVGIPWMVAFALRADGWYLRSDIIWEKPNAMPESVRDRPTKSHEYLFLLSKSKKYYYDKDSILEPYTSIPTQTKRDKHAEGYQADYTKGNRFSTGARDYYANGGRNKRTVWSVSAKPFKGAHFAVFPPDLIKPCILAGCPVGGKTLDPFGGSGTVAMVASELGRDSIYIDLNAEYMEMAKGRASTLF